MAKYGKQLQKFVKYVAIELVGYDKLVKEKVIDKGLCQIIIYSGFKSKIFLLNPFVKKPLEIISINSIIPVNPF